VKRLVNDKQLNSTFLLIVSRVPISNDTITTRKAEVYLLEQCYPPWGVALVSNRQQKPATRTTTTIKRKV